MDLLDVGVTTEDITDALQVLAILGHDQGRTVVVEDGTSHFERHTGARQEVLNAIITRVSVGRTRTSGGATEWAGGAARGSGRGASTDTGHLGFSRRTQREELGFKVVRAGVRTDFDDTRVDRVSEVDLLGDEVDGLLQGDVTERHVDGRILTIWVDDKHVHALVFLIIGLGDNRQLGDGAVEWQVADIDFRNGDRAELI